MSRIDELPADLRAVLSLILRRQKSYAEIAAALQIDEDEVRERAHSAIAELADDSSDELDDSERERIGDYLLAQQGPEERLVTYDELEGSPSGRAFAQAAARELAALPGAKIPEIPGAEERSQRRGARTGTVAATEERSAARPQGSGARRKPRRTTRDTRDRPPPTASAPPQSEREPKPERAPRQRRVPGAPAVPSSRVGGAIVLGLIVVGAIVAIIVTSTSGGSSSAGAKGQSSTAVGSSGATGSTGASQVHLNKQLKLTPPSGGNAVGAAAVLSESGRYVLALAAEHLPASQGFFYAAWLYNSPTDAYPLGKAPSVSSNGQLAPVAQALPESAGRFHQLILTKETTEHPSSPGETVLVGPFSLH